MRFCVLLVAGLLISGSAVPDETLTNSYGFDWRVAWMRYKGQSEDKRRGLVAWVQTPERQGVAFRCDKGILYAFVAVEPVDLLQYVRKVGGMKKERMVTATVGEFAPREEKWMSVHGGRIMMARRISTTKRMFRIAREGSFIRIEDGQRDPFTVEIPADPTGVLDQFESSCELHDRFDGPAD